MNFLPLLGIFKSKPFLLLAIAIAVGSATFFAGYNKGVDKGISKLDSYKQEVYLKQQEYQAALAAANAQIATMERNHEKEVADINLRYQQAQQKAEADDQKRISDLQSGISRLRLQVSSCNSPGSSEAISTPGPVDGTGSAYLAPETSAALYSIAGDGDRAVRKLNALQEWAKEAIKLCGESDESE